MQATDDDRVQNALQVASLRTSHRTDREDLPFLFLLISSGRSINVTLPRVCDTTYNTVLTSDLARFSRDALPPDIPHATRNHVQLSLERQHILRGVVLSR